MSRLLRIAEPVLWSLGAVLLAHVPGVASAWPAVGVLEGRLGLVLVALGSALTAARAWPGAVRAARDRLAGASDLALLALGALWLVPLGLYYQGGMRAFGDEPHYLIMAQSLGREGDLDLRDNYAREDWREYTPGPLAPHYGAPRPDGRPYPAHSAGLPALLAPVYALGGRAACVALLALIAAATAVQCRALARQATERADAAIAAWAVALGPPVAFYGFHVYTEGPSALALVSALRLLLAPSATALSGAGAALCLAFLPWLHVKMIPAAAAGGIAALVLLRGRARAAFVASAAAMALGFAAYYAIVFGTPSPLALYGGVPRQASGASPVEAIAGLLLDRSFGLLPHAPAFVLALAGLGALARSARRDWPHLLVGAAVLAPLVTWRMWWGGQCPPGRFLVPLVPLLALCAARRVASSPAGLARWTAPLAGLGFALATAAALLPGELLLVNRGDRPSRLWGWLAAGGVEIGRYLPSLVTDPAEWRVAAVWLAVIAGVLTADVVARRSERVDRAFASLGAPLLLLAAAGTAIDLWAR